ncbi:sce7725 family protein [Streptococcus loxodontisalivarius]|uniref:Sce7725 family protein n=1 Tax=Streptococcus loxodontisalivarius TaxID=1349415 RepID=A0ABS2PTG9_9STRE|nr:sce7725 family protein [Streptococcus loxodontisalivarius]MBM7643336.1 hypothetical protein [Streptococcus loxodontisalivarius]
MYFPYLRGRQYELIALRELLDNDKLGEYILPIIEPVKLSSTLINILEKFQEKNQNCSLVMNPQVGSFVSELGESQKENLVERLNKVLEGNNHLLRVSLMSKDYNETDDFNQTKDAGKIIICKQADDLEGYKNNYINQDIAYNIISENSRLKREVKDPRVKINDNFIKLPRNTDYLKNEDEFYTDDHLYFSADGYKGFSDYSIVGEDYSESGFAPYAVAIHIVYFDEEFNLRVNHFVSNSNTDPSNPAGKFKEALEKLITAVRSGKIQRTIAIDEFERLYNTESYPGLGTVKKLSIMHHIELIANYFKSKEES